MIPKTLAKPQEAHKKFEFTFKCAKIGQNKNLVMMLRQNKEGLFFLIILLLLLSGCEREPEPVLLSGKKPYQVYFSPQDSLYPHLVYLIQGARKSIDAAFYKIELKEVSSALLEAHKRGIRVRVVVDDLASQGKDSQSLYLRGFGLLRKDEDPESFMHHKFCVIDEEIVWTGSFNPTPRGAFKENNDVVIIKSSSLAADFLREFQNLWKKEPFPPDLPARAPPEIEIEAYFSLRNNIEEALSRELKKAKESIHFALFTFTSPKIARTLIHKYAENVEIKGIMEKDQDSPFSQYRSLKKLRMEVEWDKNFYFMHHKFFVIDKQVVITGSFNPTWHAQYQNRENLLIIYSPSLAGKYEEEFGQMWRKWYERS